MPLSFSQMQKLLLRGSDPPARGRGNAVRVGPVHIPRGWYGSGTNAGGRYDQPHVCFFVYVLLSVIHAMRVDFIYLSRVGYVL